MKFPLNKTSNFLSKKNFGLKPYVIFIHGNSTDSGIWKNQLSSELLSEYPMLAIDLPGHGKSVKMDSYSILTIVKILAEKIQEYENVILVGHSLGGHFAIETLPYINNCKGLFLFGTGPLASPPNLNDAFLPNENVGLLFQNELARPEVEKFTQMLSYGSGSLEYDIVASVQRTDSRFREGMAVSVANGELADEVDILKKCQFPIGVVHGLKDALINLDYIKKLQIDNLWRNEVQVMADCSHSPQIERPEQFNRLLLSFLQDI